MASTQPSARQLPTAFLRARNDVVVTPNERTILELIRRNPGSSRAELVRATGLTAQSVSRIVEDLRSRELLLFGEAVVAGRGQPSIPLSINPEAAFALGFSIMTDAISSAIVNFRGDVLHSIYQHMEDASLAGVCSLLEKQKSELLLSSRVADDRLFGVGFGITGFFGGTGSQLNPPDPLDELACDDLQDVFSRLLGLPVWIENDGNVAADGECLHGIGNRFDNFAYIFFSKGLGGSVVIDRKACRGAFGNAGEFSGTLPAEMQAERPTLELLRTMICDRGLDIPDIDMMISDFDLDWPGVEEWVALAKPYLEQICAAIVAVVDPQAIVLGGRIPKPLAARMAKEVKGPHFSRRGVQKPSAEIVPSEVLGDATAIGAAAYPLKRHFFV